LLRLLVEQQASLSKLQQLVVEHVLCEDRPGPAAGRTSALPPLSEFVAANVAASASSLLTEPLARPDTSDVSLSETESITAPLTSSPEANDGEPLPKTVAPTAPSQTEIMPSPPVAAVPESGADSPFGVAPAKTDEATTPTTSSPSATVAVNSRVNRYLNRPASAPARQVTNQELNRLSRLRELGDVAQLVLQFGEYRGATLFQVAQTDPDYLRSLALTAQRPQVRAAAMQLVRALEASEQFSARRTSTKKTRLSRQDT
jgi:hypothetical protein